MADIQILVDKSPLPPGFSPVCDPLDSSEARVESWGWRTWTRGGGTAGARFLSLGRSLKALGDDRAG